MKYLSTYILSFLAVAITAFSLLGCAAKTALVYEPKGDRQCESGGLTAQQSAAKLTNVSIDVLASLCGNKTGISMMAMCGAPTSNILLHRIDATYVDDAKALGFENVNRLSSGTGDEGYAITPCDE
jgi:hypothetical protein